MRLLIGQAGVELAMIAATGAAVWCFVHLLVLIFRERRELRRRAAAPSLQLTVVPPAGRRVRRPAGVHGH